MNRNRHVIALSLLIFIQVCIVFGGGTQKQGFHHDEILTYQLSNTSENYADAFVISKRNDYLDNWHDATYFSSALPVHESHRFDYGSVYQKQTLDVHPPLFYYGIHTMSSLFPGLFSKWLGIVPNIVYFVVTQFALFAIGCRMVKSKPFGFLLVIAYGFSAIAVSSVIFIRMYAMLTMWGVLQVYCHLRIFEDTPSKRWYLLAGILTSLGVLTQYYFVILQFFLSACCFLWLIYKRHLKQAMQYAISIFAGLGVVVLYWPAIIKHVFFGYRGKAAIESLAGGTNDKLGVFLHRINLMTFNGLGVGILVVLAILMLTGGLLKRRRKENNILPNKQMIITLFVCFSGYTLIVSRIAPYTDPRYVMAVVPMMVICISWCFWYALRAIGLRQVGRITGVAALCLSLSSVLSGQVMYLFPNWNSEMAAMETSRSLDAVVVNQNAWKSAGTMLLHFQEHPQTYIMKPEMLDELDEVVATCDKGFVLYLEKDDAQEENLARVLRITNSHEELLYENGYYKMFRCEFVESDTK